MPLDESIAAFNAIADGEYDHFPEQAFFMCGGIEDLKANAARSSASTDPGPAHARGGGRTRGTLGASRPSRAPVIL